MGDLLTIPTPMATGAYTRISEMELKSLSRITNSVTVLTVSHNPEEGKYQSITDAISALPDSGGTIFIKCGTYDISSDITIPDKPVKFVGESLEECVIRRNGTLTNALFYRAKSSSQSINDVHFENLTFNANSAAIKGIFENSYNANSSGKIKIKRCAFTGFTAASGSIPVQIEGYKELVISESSINTAQYGIYLRTGSTNHAAVVEKCWLKNCGTGFLYHTGAGGLVFRENTILADTWGGGSSSLSLVYVSSSSQTKVVNNSISLSFSSICNDFNIIHFQGTGTNVCSGNSINLTCSSTYSSPVKKIYGISIDSWAIITCSGNNVTMSTTGYSIAIGINIAYAEGSSVSGNKTHVTADGTYGSCWNICAGPGASSNISITGNTCVSNDTIASQGIFVYCNYSVIVGNSTKGCHDYNGICDAGTGNVVTGNVDS